MDWSNERYVRLFTRDTPEWLCWSWQSRALWPLLIRKVDRSGVLANKLGARGVAALVGLPVEVVEAGLPDLLADGCLQVHQLGYVIPNFIEAQETPQSDKQRKRDSRERRRMVTNRDIESQNVTAGHAESRDVTIGHSRPDLADPDPEEDLPPARDPAVRVPEPQPAPTPLPGPSPSLSSIWDELEIERRAVAAHHGIEYRQLVAHDRGRHELAQVLAEAARVGTRDQTVGQVRHAIAVAGAEARADRDRVKWLTGAIFSPDNFRRLVAEDLEQAGRARAGPRRSAERAPRTGRIEPRHHTEYPDGDQPL